MPSWKKVITSGSDAELNSLYAPSITGSLHGTASWAQNSISSSYALTASYSSNLQISGSINNVDYIDFNTGSATPTWKSGRVFWDNVDGALSVYNAEADITLQVGQENWTRVRNNTGTTVTNGTVVRITGSQGDAPTIERAQSIPKSGSINVDTQILGVATHNIEDSSFGYVTTQGLVRGLNTNAFNDGETLFVGTGSAGVLQNIAPPAPYEIIPIGVCVKAGPGSSGIIYVAVQQPLDFSDLSSAEKTGTYSYGDLWTYVPSGSFGVWRHTNQLSGSYGITGSLIISSSNNTNDFQVGSNKLFVSSSGNVGIGTTTPLNKFSISSTTNDPIRATVSSDALYNRILFQKPSQTWSAGAIDTGDFAIADETAVVYRFRIFSGSSNIQINPNGTGSVSIGTTVLGSAKLHINNTTTQNSLLIEDETNPDATPFVIDRFGRTGIGTTTPTAVLHVSGNAGSVRYEGDNHVYQEYFPQGISAGRFGFIGYETSGSTSLNFWNEVSTGAIRFGTENTTRMFISSSGNVGIGTQTPTQPLQVAISGSSTIGGTSLSGSALLVGTINNGIGIDNNELYSAGNEFIIGTLGSNNISFRPNSTPRMVISSSGDVGIGITIPTAKLHVNNLNAGNSFLVEDSTNPDATPFVIDNTGNVGIGKLTPSTTLDISGSVIITGSFDASSYPNKIIAITELTSSTLVTHTVGTTNFTAINLNSDGTNRFAKASFIAPLSGRVEISMEFDMTIVNSSAVQMVGLHNTSSATSTPSEGWYRVNADNDSTSGQFYAKFIETGLTPGTAYNYYFMGVCDFSGNTIRTSRIQTGAYAASSDLPSPLRIYVYDLGSALISTNPSS